MTKRNVFLGLTAIPAIFLGSASIASAVPVLNLDNGNHYDVIEGSFTFDEAIAHASTQVFMGLSGHVVTITSQLEQDFLDGILEPLMDLQDRWFGASDRAVEGEWRWVTGPEAGTLFWDNGVTVTFAAWGPGEPNNASDEDFGHFFHADNTWNDIGDGSRGYVIEWETGTHAVPEPAVLGLLGLAALIGWSQRRRG